jgi:hypothetical protein
MPATPPDQQPTPIAAAKAQEATQNFSIRPATVDDIPALQKMIEESLRGLGKGYYTQAELDGSIGYLFGPDTLLLHVSFTSSSSLHQSTRPGATPLSSSIGSTYKRSFPPIEAVATETQPFIFSTTQGT